jgi:hypothetical protein
MKLPLIGVTVDERFLTHRLRSSSTAGILTAMLALLLFAWHYYVDHFWSWDLFVVAVTFVVVKLGLMAWYRSTD